MADELYWTAPNPTYPPTDLYDQSSSWYDVTTRAAATTAPTGSSTVVVGKGLHVLPGGFDLGDSSASLFVAMAGANVKLASPAPVPASPAWHFNTIDIQAGACVAGAVIFANDVNVGQGATFSPQEGGDHTGDPDAVIGALHNDGGDFVGSDGLTVGLVAADHPVFVQNWGGDPDTFEPGTFGFEPGESVIPVTNGLDINLGTIAQGTSLEPINVALANLTTNEFLFAGGTGFSTTLLPIIAPLVPGSTEQAAILDPDTATLGFHTEHIIMSGAAGTQTLTVTDHII
jgi:hypothetical protein